MTGSLTYKKWQLETIEDAVRFLLESPRGSSRMYTAPTGSGKSYVHIGVHERFKEKRHVTIVPSIEIAQGIVSKIPGVDTRYPSREVTELYGVYTYMTYKNRLLDSLVPYPTSLSYDEGHHSISDTGTDIWDLTGRPPRISLTATGYRGTPEETADLHKAWGTPREMLSLKDAIAEGFITKPEFVVWPLVNDDLIDIVNGEFAVRQLDKSVKDSAQSVVDRCYDFFDQETLLYDKPTCVTLPSVASLKYIRERFEAAGLPAVAVTGETTQRLREFAFRETVERKSILLQINVVGEGVDLPLRRMIDLAPTMSPLLWMQRLGRITRPSTYATSTYIACNHNLSRHAYLWQGLIPASEIRAAQQAWGPNYKMKRRTMARALGLEGFGRFAVSPIPLADGLVAAFYGLQTKDGLNQYALLIHPTDPKPHYFTRTNEYLPGDDHLLTTLPDGTEIRGRKKKYGPWRRMKEGERIPDLQGYISLPPDKLTPGMLDWWKAPWGAKKYGLDPEADVNARQFQLLPILKDCRIRIRGEQ